MPSHEGIRNEENLTFIEKLREGQTLPSNKMIQWWKNIKVIVVNRKRNKELIKNCPHRNVVDLAAIYKIDADEILGGYVTKEVQHYLGVDEKDLFFFAKKNFLEKKPFKILDLEDIENMKHLTSEENDVAKAILFKSVLDEMAASMNDDIYIIPIDPCDLLFVDSKCWKGKEWRLLKNLKESNEHILNEADFLSDNIYHYNREKRKLTLIRQDDLRENENEEDVIDLIH